MKCGSSSSSNSDNEENNLDAPTFEVDKEEIISAYENYLIGQSHSYLQGLPGNEGEGEAAPSIVDLRSQFDAEHVEGMIRSLVAARSHLCHNVGVFPVFNIDTMRMQAKDVVVNKILLDVQYQHLVKDPEPLIERSLVAHIPHLLKQRDNEELRRNQQDQQINQLAEEILNQNQIDQESTFFRCHLDALAFSEHSFLGNVRNPQLSFDHCAQFIIPFRQVSGSDDAGSHYTVAVVNSFQEDGQAKAKIKYYDSLGHDLEEQYQQQLVNFFCDMGYEEVQYECISEHEQRDHYNCAIFAALKAIDIANENANNDERFLKGLNVQTYAEKMLYFRNKLANLLSQVGYNIELTEKLFQAAKRQQGRLNQQKARNEQKDKITLYKILGWGIPTALWFGYRLWNRMPPLPAEVINTIQTMAEVGGVLYSGSQLAKLSYEYSNSKKRKADELENDPFSIPHVPEKKRKVVTTKKSTESNAKKSEPILFNQKRKAKYKQDSSSSSSSEELPKYKKRKR